MAIYLITGVSRNLGFEFLRQLSENPANKIVGLVRDKATTEKKVAAQLESRQNIHIVQGDVTDYASLEKAIKETAEITGGALDYVIANAGLISIWSEFDPLGVLGEQPEKLEQDLLNLFNTNVIGNIHLFNLCMPLVLRGGAKKVIALSSGLADTELAAKYDLATAAPYSISKAALNAAVAKFSAQYAKDGVLFLSISPGMVETGQYSNVTGEQMQQLGGMLQKFQAYAPYFTGPTTPESAIRDMLSVIDRASLKTGYGGLSVSQFGTKQWL